MRWQKSVRAFSLLEVVFGALLFSMVMVGLATGWSLHERSVKKYRDQNLARTLLQNEMEVLRSTDYHELEAYADTVNASPAVEVQRSVDGQATLRTYRREITVTEESNRDVKDVVVKVSFVDDRDTLRELEVETYVFYSAR